MKFLELPRSMWRMLLRRQLSFGVLLLGAGLMVGALLVRSGRVLSFGESPPNSKEWMSVTGPPRLADEYFAVTTDNGTKQEWLFNPNTRNWERIKKVYAWMPLDENVVPLTEVGESNLRTETWKAQLSAVQTGQIALGSGHTLTLGVHVRYGRIERHGHETRGRWDPTGVVQKMQRVRWGGVRFIQEVRVVKETIHDEQGASHATPLNLPMTNCEGTAGSDLVTDEETVSLLGSLGGQKFYSPNTATAIFKQIER